MRKRVGAGAGAVLALVLVGMILFSHTSLAAMCHGESGPASYTPMGDYGEHYGVPHPVLGWTGVEGFAPTTGWSDAVDHAVGVWDANTDRMIGTWPVASDRWFQISLPPGRYWVGADVSKCPSRDTIAAYEVTVSAFLGSCIDHRRDFGEPVSCSLDNAR